MNATFSQDLTTAFRTILGREPKLEATEMDDRNGNPTQAIVVEGGLVVYPMQETVPSRPSILPFTGGTVTVTKIAIDRTIEPMGHDDPGGVDELALVSNEGEAIIFILGEVAMDAARNIIEGEAMARYFSQE